MDGVLSQIHPKCTNNIHLCGYVNLKCRTTEYHTNPLCSNISDLFHECYTNRQLKVLIFMTSLTSQFSYCKFPILILTCGLSISVDTGWCRRNVPFRSIWSRSLRMFLCPMFCHVILSFFKMNFMFSLLFVLSILLFYHV